MAPATFAAACSRGSSVHTGSPWITSLCWRHFSFRLHSLNFGPVADCVAVVEEVGEAVEDEVFGAGLTLVGQSRCLWSSAPHTKHLRDRSCRGPPMSWEYGHFWPRLHPAGLKKYFSHGALAAFPAFPCCPPVDVGGEVLGPPRAFDLRKQHCPADLTRRPPIQSYTATRPLLTWTQSLTSTVNPL